MAAFKDPYLKQIVDDLNILNVDTIPAPLTVEQCSLSEIEEDFTGGGVTNTKALLTVIGDANFPSGTMRVHYRRLDLDTLTTATNREVSFTGAESQTKTLAELVTKFAPGIASYILPELEGSGPYDLTRDSMQVTLRAKEDSTTLIGSVTIHCYTEAQSIVDWNSEMGPYFFRATNLDDILPYAADFNQEVLNRVMKYNGFPDAVVNANTVQMTFGVGVRGGSDQAYVDIDFLDNTLFTGTNRFWYARLQPNDAFGISPVALTSDETDFAAFVDAVYVAKNVYPGKYPADMGLLYPRSIGTNQSWSITPLPDDPLYAAGFGEGDHVSLVQNPILTIPYEAVFDFNVAVAGIKQFLTQGYNNGPTSFTVISGPAGAPGTVSIDVDGKTGVSLPVGDYQVSVAMPDSRQIRTSSFSNFDSVRYSSSLRITRVRTLKGVNFDSSFANSALLTTIDQRLFTEAGPHNAGAVYSIDSLFSNCTTLATVPAGLFDALTRCGDFDGVFRNCAVASLPTQLFANQRFIFSQARTLSDFAKGCPLPALPSSLFHNVEGWDLSYAFRDISLLETIPVDLFTGYHRPVVEWQYNYILSLARIHNLTEFLARTKVSIIPPALFTVFKNQPYEVSFESTFATTRVVSPPTGLFAFIPLYSKYVEIASTPTFELHRTFYNCQLLTSVPSDFFQDVDLTYPGYVFEKTGLTSIPANLFANQPNMKYATGLFYNSLVSTIPAGLFAGCTALQVVKLLFSYDTALTSVPAGLFANLPALKSVEQAFSGCSALTSVEDGLFTNSPNVENLMNLFSLTKMPTVPVGLFQPCAASIKTIENMFYNNTELTTIPAGLFDNMTSLDTVRAAFGLCAKLSNVPSRLFGQGSNALITTLDSLFSSCSLLATVPGDIFDGLTEVKSVASMFRQSGLTALPSGIFSSFAPKLEDASYLAVFTTSLVTLPTGLFAGAMLLRDLTQAFYGTGVVNPPAGMFPPSTTAITMSQIFDGAKVKNIPTDFILCKNVTNLTNAFRNCPLESIGNNILVNEYATSIAVTGMFGQQAGPTWANPTVGVNLISSTILVMLNGSTGENLGIFGANPVITAEINDLFGFNVRFGSVAFFANKPNLTNSGLNFIAKHDVANAVNRKGIFKGCTGLSDFASLPAYATTYP